MSKKILLLALACAGMLAGCDDNNNQNTPQPSNQSGTASSSGSTNQSATAQTSNQGQNTASTSGASSRTSSSTSGTAAAPAAERADTAGAVMNRVSTQGIGDSIGSVTFTDTDAGIEIRVNLRDLPTGQLGFHVHENGDCAPAEKDGVMTAAQAAGGHYDPDRTGKHLGPEGGGHKGDLPYLTVSADGTDTQTLSVRGVKVADFHGRALIVHEGGDNYSDMPQELGGGGGRIACGVIR